LSTLIPLPCPTIKEKVKKAKKRRIDDSLGVSTNPNPNPKNPRLDGEERFVSVECVSDRLIGRYRYVPVRKSEGDALRCMMTNAELTVTLYDKMEAAVKECRDGERRGECLSSETKLQTIDDFLKHVRLPSSRALVNWVCEDFQFNLSYGQRSQLMIPPDAFRVRFRGLFTESLAGKSDTCWGDLLHEKDIDEQAVVLEKSLNLGPVEMKSNMKKMHELCPQVLAYTGRTRIKGLTGTRQTSQNEREWYIMRVYEHLGYIPTYLLSLVSLDMFKDFKKGELDHVSFEEWFNEIYFSRASWLRSKELEIGPGVPESAINALYIFSGRSLEMKQVEAEIRIISLLPGELTAIITLYLKALFFKV